MKKLILQAGIGLLMLCFFGTVWAGTALGGALLRSGMAGETVKAVQVSLRQLGYQAENDGIYGQSTVRGVTEFQAGQGLAADGIYGPLTQGKLLSALRAQGVMVVFPGDSLYGIAQDCNISLAELMGMNGLTTTLLMPGHVLKIPPVSGKAELLDWWKEAQYIFAREKIAKITDVDTGISYRVIRKAGTNHADCQPLTAADTAAMKRAYQGEWSWERRAIIVEVDGRALAASQNGMPHEGQSIYDNNFDGHFCIHFLNSRTHGTDRVDENHQAMVQKAAKGK